MERLYQITGILVRIAAIFIVIRTISYFPNWYFSFSSGISEPKIIGYMVLYSLLLFIVAVFLWKYPLFISRKIIPEINNENKYTDVPFEQIQVGLLSILGIGIIVFNLSDLLYWYSYLRALESVSDPSYPIGPGVYASLYSTILELIFGFWLMLGSKGIIGLINKLRYGGLQNK